MKRFRIPFTLSGSWQVASTLIIIAAGVGLLLFGSLDSLLPGYSETEVRTANESRSLSVIADNPINAPYKLLVLGIATTSGDPLLATRLAAGFFAIITLGLFYFGVRQWHTGRIAFLATVLFGCSAWFLHTARFGSPDILLPLVVLLFAVVGYWIASAERSGISYLTAVLALSVSIYVPGTIWLVLLALAVRRTKDFRVMAREFTLWHALSLTVALIALVVVPLALTLSRDPSFGLTLLGVPESWPGLTAFAKELAVIPLSLVVYSSFSAEFWLSSLPLLDIFSSALLFIGAYYFLKLRSLDRAKLVTIFIVLSAILVALPNAISLAALLPVVYIFISGGLALLLGQWLTVFPRNPLAQNVGITFIAIAVAASAFYNVRAYFVAWPNNTKTESAYSRTTEDLLQ